MAHVSIGPIAGTSKWRVKRDATIFDCHTEAEARHVAKSYAAGGLNIVEATFTNPPAPKAEEPAPEAEPEVAVNEGNAPPQTEPEEEPEAPKKEVSALAAAFEIRRWTITKLVRQLATGDYDDVLDALEDGEKTGDNRKGALKAIQARRETLAQ